MKVKEANRKEIETRLKTMGDYVKIDYLLSCLKQPLDFDSRRFVLMRLAELYEGRKMFLEAGKMMMSAAPINTANRTKLADFVRAAELFVKGGNFEAADIAFEKALSCGGERDKWEMKQKKINYYKNQAEHYFQNDKRNSAMIAYEKLLSLNLTEGERRETQERLLGLYEKLGKIREFFNLKRAM